MERKADHILKLKTELSELGSEIEKLIVRADKVGVEIKQGYDEMETALQAKQSWTQARLGESLMSGDEVWQLIWDNVWDALKEFNHKAAIEIKQEYKELEPALKAKQAALQVQLHGSTMSGDEVFKELWNEIWNEFWGVVEGADRKAATEIKQVRGELEALEAKQSVLLAKMQELSGDEVWNVVKDVTHGMVE
ncbi:MAG TPA: hypothetical protein VN426_14255 [Syntrophomonadaceae bacterium]|nr:hypothetical protein [Syntrophomonadaceae bacterium]